MGWRDKVRPPRSTRGAAAGAGAGIGAGGSLGSIVGAVRGVLKRAGGTGSTSQPDEPHDGKGQA